MAESSHEVLCGRCKVPVEIIADSNPESVSCPRCGVRDTTQNAIREVSKQVEEVLSRSFDDTMRNAFRGSKHVKFTGSAIPKRSYRFIANVKM